MDICNSTFVLGILFGWLLAEMLVGIALLVEWTKVFSWNKQKKNKK